MYIYICIHIYIPLMYMSSYIEEQFFSKLKWAKNGKIIYTYNTYILYWLNQLLGGSQSYRKVDMNLSLTHPTCFCLLRWNRIGLLRYSSMRSCFLRCCMSKRWNDDSVVLLNIRIFFSLEVFQQCRSQPATYTMSFLSLSISFI